MGCRLYPNTINAAKLEKLAFVPEGTMRRLEEMAKRHAEERVNAANWSEYDGGYRQWKERDEDGSIGDLDAFLTFGWGKFDGGNGECGGTLKGAEAQALLDLNGIRADADYCEGVHWC
jgi:hypothetical protein